MNDDELLYKLYRWFEKKTQKATMSREKELAILAYKLGKGEMTIKDLEDN